MTYPKHMLVMKCVLCGDIYCPDCIDYVCPKHGDEGILDVEYDYEVIRPFMTREKMAQNHDCSIWRYKPLLPVHPKSPVPPLQVGWTPLYETKRLGEAIGVKNLYIKDDGRNPTASLKDRASAVGVTKAMEIGAPVITAASTGNAASSLAGICASVGMPNIIFVPQTAPKAKIAQLIIFGATVIMVRGTYDDAFDLCLAASKEFGWYSRNTAYNPYLSEGKKTAALEICEQFNWDGPDTIVVSVGDGCIIGGLAKGLRDLKALGLIEKMPRIVGVQAEGSQVIATAWRNGTEAIRIVPPTTMADSISVGKPRDAIKAIRAVKDTEGCYVVVSDEEILDAMKLLGRNAGVFGEPAGVTPLAGVRKLAASHAISADERVVVLITGNGLKDVDSAMRAVSEPVRIAPSMDELKKVDAIQRYIRS